MSESELILRLKRLIEFYEKLGHAYHGGRDVADKIKKAIDETAK